MLLLITGDLHLTDKTPEKRIDNYAEACLNKFKFILDQAKARKVDAILQPGDFFDSPNPSYLLFKKVAQLINDTKIPILTVFGQHDLRYRNRENTALNALSVLSPYVFVNQVPRSCDNIYNNVCIQMSGWEESVPKPKLKAYNILITHRMIINEKIWEGQESFEYANNFLKDNKFDLIVSGDNHIFFSNQVLDRWLINCGSMMRSNITQTEHFPKIIFFDTESHSWRDELIPIKPVEEIFEMEQIIKTKEHDKKLEAFVDGLSQHKEMGLSFEDNLSEYIKKNKIDPAIHSIIRENMS